MIKFVPFFFAFIIVKSLTGQVLPELVLPTGHKGTVERIGVSPEGQYLVSVSEGFRVILWHKNSGRTIKNFAFAEGNITDIAFADEKSFILLFDNGLILRFDAETGREIFRTWSDNKPNRIKIFDNKLFTYYTKQFEGLTSLFTGNTQTHETIEVRNIITGEMIKSFTGRLFLDKIDHDNFVSTSINNDIVVYDSNFVKIKSIPVDSEVEYLGVIPNGILYATSTGKIYLWEEFETSKIISTLHEKFDVIRTSPSGTYIASADFGTLDIIQTHDSGKKYNFTSKSPIEDIYFNPKNEDEVLIIFENGLVVLYNFKLNKGNSFSAHKGWNGEILGIGGNEVITRSDDDYFITWSLNPFKPRKIFGNELSSIRQVRFAPDYDELLALTAEKNLLTFSPSKYKPGNIRSYPEKVNDLSEIFEDSLVFVNKDDLKTDMLHLHELSYLTSYNINPDSLQNNFITGSDDTHNTLLFNGSVIIQHVKRNNTLIFRDFDGEILENMLFMGIRKVIASARDKYLLVCGTATALFLNDRGEDLTMIGQFDNHLDKVAFSSCENKFVFNEVNQSQIIKIFDINKGGITSRILSRNPVLSIGRANEQNHLPFATIDTLKIVDLNSETLAFEIAHNYGAINDMYWQNDSIVIIAGDDGRIHLFNTFKKETEYSFIFFADNEYIILTADGYYYSNTSKLKKISYVNGVQPIGFEQLDLRFNRPDMVLQAMSITDRNLIESYHKAWQKRVRHAGIDTLTFSSNLTVPVCFIENRDLIPYENSTGTVHLNIAARSMDIPPDRLNIWINDVPLFGKNGVKINSQLQSLFDTSCVIPLSVGENKIEASVLNKNGIESFRSPLYVKYTPDDTKGSLFFFIGIGVDRYLDPGHNLNYSVKDIRDLVDALKQKHGDNLIVDTLFNEHVTINSIKELKSRLLHTDVNDKVVISFSGHGLLSRNFDYYLATHTTNFTKPEQGGLPYEDIEWLIDSIPARQKLLLIDACHSGEVDRDELVAINSAKKPDGIKGAQMTYEYEPTLGMKSSFELMQELFTNVNRGTGATIISAAAGTQFAYERGDLANGVFTYSILELMNQKDRISVSELKSLVGKRVEELTNGLQKPTSRTENIENDWWVW